MMPRILTQHAALIGAVVSLTVAVFPGQAQSPATLAGRTIQLTIGGGTFPFALSGVYRFLPSGVDSVYAIVPITGDTEASTGTYAYAKTGANTAQLSIADTGAGGLVASCTFSTPNSGTYILTSAAVPGGSQSGTFVLYAGAAPTTIAGSTITVTITSGGEPFADWGSYQFLPTSAGSYTLITLSGSGQNTSGSYSYNNNSAYTGVIAFNDSIVGPGLTSQLSFDTPTSGTVFLRKSGSIGYQTGLFSMTAPEVAPVITTQPSGQTVNVGASVSFSVSASGTGPLAIQWRKNGINIPGANLPTYTIGSVQPSDQGAYDAVVSNPAGSVTSLAANLVVAVPPTITAQPSSITVALGTSATFSVTATGSAPLAYQWRKNQADIAGANLAAFTISGVQASDAGSYSVRVSNPAGSVTSNPANLQITAAEPPVFENLAWSRGSGFSAVLRGQAQTSYRIQASTDLAEWVDLTNFTAAAVTTPIIDLEAASQHSTRYYRAVVGEGGSSGETNPDPTHLVWIAPGTFTMGSSSAESGRLANEEPQTQVTISQGFWISKYETTQEQYLAVVGNNPSTFTGDLKRPVEQVSWYDATNYCGNLTAQARAAGHLPEGYAYRLPTEAEWEFAARAGTTTQFSYGDDPSYTHLGEYGWYAANGGGTTQPVGAKMPNSLGVYDMPGNVWEWCWDWYGAYPGGSVTDPRGPNQGVYRVYRGGSFFDGGSYCRSASRYDYLPSFKDYRIGFRAVLATGQ